MDCKVLKLVTPEFRPAPAYAGQQGGTEAEMHFRFEIKFIVDEITGPAPVVKVLEIAWLEKRRYVRRFLLDYYERYRTLPHALHDLGTTRTHELYIGVVDFARVRDRIHRRLGLRRSSRSFWSKWFSQD